jgi:hypothetical protein
MYTYTQVHRCTHSDTRTYAQVTKHAVYTHTHRKNTHVPRKHTEIHTYTRYFRHTSADIQSELSTDTHHRHICTQIRTHLSQTHTFRHGAQIHTNLHVHTHLPDIHWPMLSGHACRCMFMSACTRQCGLQAHHSSLCGTWPAAGPGPGSGGWVCRGGGGSTGKEGGGWLCDLGRLEQGGPVRGCPAPSQGRRAN